MNSIILRVTATLLITLLMMFSIVLLLRGHDSPGGGFSGGIVATTAWAFYSLAFGPAAMRYALKFHPRVILATGLLISLGSGMIGPIEGKPFLTGVWSSFHLSESPLFELGSPLLFDLGVYLVILGMALNIIIAIEQEQ